MYKKRLSEKAMFLMEHPRNDKLVRELCVLLDKHYNTVKYNYLSKNEPNGPLTAVGIVNFISDNIKISFDEVIEDVK